MLYDRPYLSAPRDTPARNPLYWVMGALIAMFVAEHAAAGWFKSGFIADHGPLSIGRLFRGELWTLFTYDFVLDIGGWTGGLLGLVFNLIVLNYCGREILARTSNRLFLGIYSGLILAGALFWVAGSLFGINWPLYDPSIAGAGLFALFCFWHAGEPMTFLLFFLVPITIKPKNFVWFWVALDLFGFVFYEMMGRPSPFWNGHLARLGTIGTAFLYHRYLHERLIYSNGPSFGLKMPSWLKRRKSASPLSSDLREEYPNKRDFRAEVDRILDKINSQGFGALTEREKRVLDEAKDLLGRANPD